MSSARAVKAADQPVNPGGGHASTRHRIWIRIAWLSGALLLVAIVVTHGIHKGEFILNLDEPHHAFTGLFFADFFRDLPLRHPIQYTYLYYARYPVLSIVHWPPVFYGVEGVIFLLFGPSVAAARLAILLFVLFGLFFWFRLIRDLEGDVAAAVSTAVLGLLPFLLLYEKSVMLEAPSLALCIAAIYFWVRFLRDGMSRHAYWFAVLAAFALLTKQQSIFLVPFCILTILTGKKWRLPFDRRLWIAIGLVLIIAGPFYVTDFILAPRGIHESLAQGNRIIAHPAAYYWSILPKQLGWPLLLLAVLGIVTFRWWARSKNALFMLMWIVACYLMFTPIAIKEPRYILDWVPPFVYFAIVPWASNTGWWRRRWLRPVAVAVMVALVVSEAWLGWRYQRPYVSGYAAAAKQVVSEDKPSIVLYDAELSANFCFFLRAADPARRYVLMRKGLYAVDEGKLWGAVEIVKTRQGLQNLLSSYGVRFIFVDNGPLDFPIQKTLRNLLQTPQFRLIRVFPIETNVPWLEGRKLSLYENLDATAPTAKTLRLRMLTLRHDIVVPLNKLLKQ